MLAPAVSEARDVGLEDPALEALFRRLVELAKAIQMRSTSEHSLDLKPSLDLNREVRPALLGLGKRASPQD